MCSENRRQKIKNFLKLYLVLETGMLKMPLEKFIPAIIKGGITAVQLRDKDFEINERYATGLKLKELLSGTGIPFIINDRIDLALALDADMVHVGLKDIPASVVKSKFSDFTVGYSCNSSEDIHTAESAGVDYIGVGPAFVTDTKKDLRAIRGMEGIKSLAMSTSLPSVAIGGIGISNILELKNSGISGVAVSSSICASENPYEVTAKLRELAEQL